MVKNPSATAKHTGDLDSIPSQEDPLEEEVSPHCNFLAGESHEQSSLEDQRPCNHKELDTTEQWSTYTHRRREKNGSEQRFVEIMVRSCLHMGKEIATQLQEAQRVPCKEKHDMVIKSYISLH